MSYRTSEEQLSMMPQRGRGMSKGYLRTSAGSSDTKNPSFYRSEDQDTSADKTLGFANQGNMFGQRKIAQGKGDGNSKPKRDEMLIYRVPPRANEGAARETTIPESKADGSYVLRYCPHIKSRRKTTKRRVCATTWYGRIVHPLWWD